MAKQRRIRTTPAKGPTIFASVGLLLCTAVILWFSFSNDAIFIRLIFIVFCGIFDVMAFILFASQVFVVIEIEGEYIHRWVMFVHKKVKLNKIKQIKYYDNGYTLYLKGDKKFGVIPSGDPLAGEMIYILEKNGAKTVEK